MKKIPNDFKGQCIHLLAGCHQKQRCKYCKDYEGMNATPPPNPGIIKPKPIPGPGRSVRSVSTGPVAVKGADKCLSN